jgi:hypothetical protein
MARRFFVLTLDFVFAFSWNEFFILFPGNPKVKAAV